VDEYQVENHQKTIRFYKRFSTESLETDLDSDTPDSPIDISGTCTEAEPYALQVQDDSMEPEFAEGCIIIVDPTGIAVDGAFVLADVTKLETEERLVTSNSSTNAGAEAATGSDKTPSKVSDIVFRQLRQRIGGDWFLQPLDSSYPGHHLGEDLSSLMGVIVQRAGKRRSYHKRYD